MTAIRFRLNDADFAEDVAPRLSLADLLRERHNLTATHLGCEHGVCGACTVLVDGMPARACLMLAAACDDRQHEGGQQRQIGLLRSDLFDGLLDLGRTVSLQIEDRR